LAERLAGVGFDLVAAGRVADYHRQLAPTAEFRLAPFPGVCAPEERLVVLIGHSRAVWAPFLAALAREPWRREVANPLDAWTADVLTAALAVAVPPGVRTDTYAYWEPPPRRVAMQVLAAALGLAARGPAGLSAHPIHGPWIAFRAAVVIDTPGPLPTGTPAPSNADVCARCARTPCAPALAAALAATATHDAPGVAASWQRWVAVRDACPIGRDRRYSEAQLRYHYTGDRRALRLEST
jgi:methylmalonic aciduria homocystinuria type C protein